MKYYSIEDETGGLLGYVKVKDNVDAYEKVLNYYCGVCPDNRLINEIDVTEIDKHSLRALDYREVVEL